MIKNNRGITVISLSIAVIILLIITGMLVYSAKDSVYVKNLTNMQNDISNLRDKISLYYSQYGALPASTPYTNTSMVSRFPLGANDDLNGFLIIDLKALDGLTLNYGKDYEKYKDNNSIDQSELMDIYVINQKSHNIFYVQGVGVKENGTTKIYYTDYTEGDKEAVELVEPTIKGKYYEEDTEIKVEEIPVTIPGGATVSGIEGEYENVDNGFVIYITKGDKIEDWNADEDENGIKDVQEDYDQFVWVPVEKAYIKETEIASQTGNTNYEKLQNYLTETNAGKTESEQIYPMAIQLSDGTYKGLLYNFEEESGVVKVTPLDYTTDDDYREPTFLTDSQYADGSSYNNVGITKNSLQSEFNTMVEKVDKNKGFWVGRYETSRMVEDNTQDNTNEIKVIRGTTEGINSVQWYRMYAQQKSYSSLGLNIGSTIKSNMIWGCQWDQIMIWMKGIKNTVDTTNGQYYVTNAVGMGNYGSISGVEDGWSSTTTPAPTGYQENYKVKNIYDLAGNVHDWTLEANYIEIRVKRRRKLCRC